MPGTGGFRKMRWADARRGKGQRGGLRIIYYYFPADHQIWLMTLYDKNEASDLTAREKKALKAAMESELKTRAAKRASGTRQVTEDQLMAKRDVFSELMEGVGAMKSSPRGQDHAAQLQSRGDAAAQGGFEAHPGHAKETALLTSGVRAQIADQRKNAGEMGTGAGETESSGSGAGSSRAQVSGYAGAAG